MMTSLPVELSSGVGCTFMRGSDWDVLFGSSYVAVNRSAIKAVPSIWSGWRRFWASVFTALL